MFKVTLCMYREWIIKEKVVKLRSLYIKGFKVVLSMDNEWITKEEVVKLRSLYITCLELRFLNIMSGSPKKKL